MINIILAVDENLAIGNNTNLLYSFKRDLERFKSLTLDSTVVMGHNTWKSLPSKLPNRKHIVLSKKFTHIDGVDKVVNNIDEIRSSEIDSKDIWIIGGAQIYQQFLPYGDRVELTRVRATVPEWNVDVPTLEKDLDKYYDLINIEKYTEKDRISGRMLDIEFVTYLKK